MAATLYGWTVKQIAYAKHRHKLHGNDDLPCNADGIIDLRHWWMCHGWPEPMSVQLHGVTPEFDMEWAERAMDYSYKYIHGIE